jgi:hypothetical protein
MILGQLLERVYRALHSDIVDGVATDGSLTTVVDASLSGRYQSQKFKNWIAFVSRTTDGQAPQSEYGIISNYVNTGTATIPTLSAAVQADDEYSFCKPDIPLYTLIKLCNDALRSLGRIPLVDTSLTLDASTIRYTLPDAIRGRKPSLVYFRHPTTYVREHAPNWYIEPGASGADATLVFKKQSVTLNTTNVFQTYDGWTIVIHYEGVHEPLTAYNSPVNETIHEELAVAACMERALQWKLYPRQRKNDRANWELAKQMLEDAKRQYPIELPIRDQQRVPIGLFNYRR